MTGDQCRAEAKRLRAYAAKPGHSETDRTTVLRLAESYEVLARVDDHLARLREYGI